MNLSAGPPGYGGTSSKHSIGHLFTELRGSAIDRWAFFLRTSIVVWKASGSRCRLAGPGRRLGAVPTSRATLCLDGRALLWYALARKI